MAWSPAGRPGGLLLSLVPPNKNTGEEGRRRRRPQAARRELGARGAHAVHPGEQRHHHAPHHRRATQPTASTAAPSTTQTCRASSRRASTSSSTLSGASRHAVGDPAAISIGGQQARGFNLKIDSGPLPEFQRFYLTVGSRAADHVVKEHVGSEHAREQGD